MPYCLEMATRETNKDDEGLRRLEDILLYFGTRERKESIKSEVWL